MSIYERAPIPGLDARDFISAFKYSGLTEPRNSEWNLAPALRRELLASPALDAGVRKAVHQLLLEFGRSNANRARAGSEIPAYLFTHAGLAYHFAGSGDLDDAMALYSEASKGEFTGAQWLGAKLAEEQEQNGVIPRGRVETTFLRAWVLLHEGHRQAAMPLFRKVAKTDLPIREVAISLHLVGNDNNRGQRREAEGELRRSIDIGEEIGNRLHVAQTLHSLANLLARQEDRFDEAEKAYRRSVEIDEQLGNQFGVAQTLHSLANLLARRDGCFDEAEKAYQRSLEILEGLHDQFGVAQTLHSLANLLSRREGRFDDAEKAYRRSTEIGEEIGNRFHVAQTFHSLANLLARREGRFDDAEKAYQRSLQILEDLNDQFGVAQTLHSLANLLARKEGRFDDAENAYQRSIAIGERLNNDRHLAQVLMSYGTAIASRSVRRALSLLHRSLEIERRRGNQRFIRMVERRIKEVRKLG
ncbi:tetratricopeptide repeat protein [Sphingomonas psychrotolerans]|uniref:Tetratricopeptide repeat protein n=1 Tax=Sphingomonas psychrotolerans TaxID=1327635 RepID=A0ABU3N2E4_9SPHN|nr:tetratricopeptide repeat protein [Sphingomonas psychrotolerans]MDT8758034.1 tetratricopeptide repeat protein [Sphingomonas psychrotolerans]